MKLSRGGWAVAGVGDGAVSVDGGVPLALLDVVAGQGAVLGPRAIAYQRRVGPEAYILEALDLTTGQTTALDSRGANRVRADGAGRWAAWTPADGVWDSDGRTWPKASLLDYHDGVLAICPDYQVGRGIRLITAEGSVNLDTAELGHDATQGPNVRVRDAGVLAYQAGGRWVLVGAERTYMAPPWPVNYLVPVVLPGGRVAILERDATRLYLRWPDQPTRGAVLSTSEDQFGPDAVAISTETIRVVWARGAGEHPREFTRVDVPVADLGRDDLTARPMPPVHVPPFSRPCWLIPYHATRHGISVECPGHAEVITNGQPAGIRLVRRPVVADMDSVRGVDDLLAVFAVVGVDNLDAARSMADSRGVPLMVYHDHVTPFPYAQAPQLVPGWDWVSVMLYCDPTESLDAFRRRAHGQVEAASGYGYGIVLTVQMFDRNGTEGDAAKMSAMQALWRDLAEAWPDVIGIAPFAVLRSAHGVTAYPFLGEWLAAYGAAMTAPDRPRRAEPPAPPPPVPPVEPPPVVPPPVTPPPPPPIPPVEPPMPDPLQTLTHEAAVSAITILYRDLLGRDPDPEGLAHYTRAVLAGLRIGDLEELIIDSAEYRGRTRPAPPVTPPPPGPTPGTWTAPAWWTNVTEAQLRNFRGDLGGMRVSERLGPKGRPHCPEDYVFTPTYPTFGPDERAEMRAAVKARGYTHFAIGPIWERGYPGWAGHNFLEDPMTYIGFLRELIDDGLIPVVWLMSDGPFNVNRGEWGNDRNPIDFAEVRRVLSPIYSMPELREVCKVAVFGWEVTDNFWIKTIRRTVEALTWFAEVAPQAFRYWHAAANNGAPCDYGEDGEGCEGKAWRIMAPFLHGHFWQDGSFGGWHLAEGRDPANPDHRRDQFVDNLVYDVNRIRGNHYQAGGLIGADGQVLDVIAGEYSAYFELNDRESEALSREYGRLALSIDGVRGFMDGGPA